MTSLCTKHTDYRILAGRIIVSNNHKNTPTSFSNAMNKLYDFKDVHNNHVPLISKELWEIVNTYSKTIDNMIDYERDFLIDYFGFKTLERAYLNK